MIELTAIEKRKFGFWCLDQMTQEQQKIWDLPKNEAVPEKMVPAAQEQLRKNIHSLEFVMNRIFEYEKLSKL